MRWKFKVPKIVYWDLRESKTHYCRYFDGRVLIRRNTMENEMEN